MPRKQTKKENSAKSKDPATQEKEKVQHDLAPTEQSVPSTVQPASENDQNRSEGEEMEEPTEQQRRNVPPNHIFIGKKPVMGYALSAVMQLTQYPTVVLRARGRAISTAVDVAQVATKRLGNGQFEVKEVKIDTEVVGEGQEARNVSTIEITLGKK
jgi:DNA-binding protein